MIPSPFHLISWIASIPILYFFIISFKLLRAPTCNKLLTFHVANRKSCSLIICFCRFRFSSPASYSVTFWTGYFLQWGVVNTTPNPQPEGPGNLYSGYSSPSLWRPNSIYYKAAAAGFGLPRVFYFPGIHHIWWTFLYPPPEEAPDGRPATPHGILVTIPCLLKADLHQYKETRNPCS